MVSLYEELLSNLGKQASTSDTIKQGIQDLDTNELMVLANELAALTGDSDLAAMAKILPVYSSGSGNVEENIQTEQAIHNVDPNITAQEAEEPLVTGPGGEYNALSATASDEEEDTKKKEDEEDDAKEEDAKKKEDEEEDKEVSASEVLFNILKEGAALEDLIEVRASEMVEAMIKQAEDYEVARQIVDGAAQALDANPIKAYEYSEQMMDKVKTVAAKKDVPMSEAAQAVTAEVLTVAAGINSAGTDKVAYMSNLDELSVYASQLEHEYEKVAEAIGETAEAMIREQGMKMGLQEPKLFDFVSRSMDKVKTLAAQKNINLAQAAKEFLMGGTGSQFGYVEPTMPSPSVAPSPVKAPINSNQTQAPDQYFAQMAANADPQIADIATQKEAAVRDYVKELIKSAMVSGAYK